MATIPEIAKRLGRHAVNAGLAAAHGVDVGYAAARKPFEEPGAEMHQAEPFAPGTVSGGAIVAKTVRNILVGSRQAAIDRQVREQRAIAAQTGELERNRLRQQIEASTLQDFTDPETGQTYKLTAADIRAIEARRLGRAPARAAASPDMSIRLKRAQDILDAQVNRDADEMAAADLPRFRDVRFRARQGDVAAFDALGLPRTLAAGLKETDPAKVYSIQAAIDAAGEKIAARHRATYLARARAKYAAQYAEIQRAIQQAGGLGLAPGAEAAPSAAPSADEGDPLLDEVLRRLDEEDRAASE